MDSLLLLVTSKCNLKCVHCLLYGHKHRLPDLDIDNLYKLILDVKLMGCKKVMLYGGEPFLWNHLFPLCYFIKENGMYLSIFTNGTLLNNHHLKILTKLGIDLLSISIFGLREIHDKFVNKRGAFDLTFNNINRALDYGLKLRLSICAAKLNINDCYLLMEMFSPLKGISIEIQYISLLGRAINNKELLFINNNEWRSFTEKCKKFKDSQDNKEIFIQQSIITEEEISKFMYLKNILTCNIDLLRTCVIDANGDIYPCCLLVRNPNYRLGNIYNKNIKDIWLCESNKVSQYEDLSFQCKECNYFKFCKGGCPAYRNKKNDNKDYRCEKPLFFPICPTWSSKCEKCQIACRKIEFSKL